MDLNEMINELEKRGFEEVPTKKQGNIILSSTGDYPAKWRSYIMPNGDLEGFSVFLEENKNRVRNTLLVLPDAIQDMYLDALDKLEKATEISLNPDPNIPDALRTNYIHSCYKLSENMHSGFNGLLGKVGINPENELSNISDGLFKLSFVVLGGAGEENILGVNYRLGLIPGRSQEKEFYLNIIDQMPEKIQELKSLNGVWDDFVDGIVVHAISNKKFYKTIGASYYS